jgi:hypothetical protein
MDERQDGYDESMAANRLVVQQINLAMQRAALRARVALVLVFVATTAVAVARQLAFRNGGAEIPAPLVGLVLLVGLVVLGVWYWRHDARIAYQLVRDRQERVAALWVQLGGVASASSDPTTWAGSIDEFIASVESADDRARMQVAGLSLGLKRPDLARRIMASIPEAADPVVELNRDLISARIEPEKAIPIDQLRHKARNLETHDQRRVGLLSVAALEAERTARSGRNVVRLLADRYKSAMRDS